MEQKETIVTDVLVVGGGMAAMFAAIKAKEDGVSVTLVDKGRAGSSGQSPYAEGFGYVNPDGDAQLVKDTFHESSIYIGNRDWIDVWTKETRERYQDLMDMGIEFYPEPFRIPVGLFAVGGPITMANLKAIQSIQSMRAYAEKIGVTIVDRIMITDLLQGKDGSVIGAIGIGTQKETIHVFQAKATILCTGASGYKPVGWPVHGLTGDGDAMAYRIGARITGKEFVDPHFTFSDNPMYQNYKKKYSGPKVSPGRMDINAADGKPLVTPMHGPYCLNELEVHQGNGPITATMGDGSQRKMNSGVTNGMSAHQAEGIWSEGTQCETDVKGLFAGGDSLGSREAGAAYPGCIALSASATTGARAGHSAAAFAKDCLHQSVNESAVEKLVSESTQALHRTGGYDPRWVITLLQNYMRPYFIAAVKEEKRLEAVLTLIGFMRDHMLPKLNAENPHDLVLAIEAKNMVLNAEMRLRASLYRKESRGTHVREDYPHCDDANFLAWVTIQNINGTMTLDKVPIPENWHPKFSETEGERR